MTMKLTTTEFSFNASLSCIDLGHIAESMEEINQSRIKSLHYDMVDGQFNECFIFGDLMLKVFRSYTKLPITVHLACRNPIPYIKPCIANGADYIAIHYEADIDIEKAFQTVRDFGAKPVLAFRCDTPVPEDFIKVSEHAEWILKLSVQPGFSGQTFQEEAVRHIEKMHQLLMTAELDRVIEVDGNIHTGIIQKCAKAGATMFTGGTSGLCNHKHSIDESIVLLEQAIIAGGNSNGIDYE